MDLMWENIIPLKASCRDMTIRLYRVTVRRYKHTWNTIIAATTKVEINWAENLKSEMKHGLALALVVYIYNT